MTPSVLIEQAGGMLPAPWWFVQFFKVLGFTLHAVLMHLWYAGLLWAMVLAIRGSAAGREAAGRLMRQMPVLVALGINLGIVPLLFLQAAYAKVFYPATIYMAWFWLGIVVLLIPAYYGVYIYSFGLRRPFPSGGPAGQTASADSEPTGSSRSEPTGSSRSEPTGSSRSEPTGPSRSEPTGPSRSEPTGSSRSEPTGSSRSEPTGSSRSEPTGPSRSEATGGSRKYLAADEQSEAQSARPGNLSSPNGSLLSVLWPAMPGWRLAAGWVSAVLFLIIGFFFVNGFTLMTRQELFRQEHWQTVWGPHTLAGAALGTGLNLADSRLLPRWLMFFSLAWTTLVVWLVVDTAWRASPPSATYRSWVARTAWKLYLAGMVGFALFGAWYLHTWSAEVRSAMFSWPVVILTVLTAISPGPVWLGLAWSARRGRPPDRSLAVLLALGQLAVLALNATSRQVVQNLELRPFFAVFEQPEAVQWSPLIVFLVLFGLGAGVLGWMLWQLWRYRPTEP